MVPKEAHAPAKPVEVPCKFNTIDAWAAETLGTFHNKFGDVLSQGGVGAWYLSKSNLRAFVLDRIKANFAASISTPTTGRTSISFNSVKYF